MNNLKEYISEKLKIDKSTKIVDEENINEIFKKFKVSETSKFGIELKKWMIENSIMDINIYGWKGINKLMDSESYIEDDKNDDVRKGLREKVINTGTKIKVEDKNIFYCTSSLFAMLSQDTQFYVIVEKK